MNEYLKIVVLFLIVQFYFLASISQSAGYIFSDYTVQKGLSSFNPATMVQDSFGFLWIGTQEGLNRFDGKKFEHYDKTQPKERRLLNNHIKALAIKGDTLWVASAMGGIDLINTENGRIIQSIHPGIEPKMNYWIEDFLFIGKDVWMGSYEGIIRLSSKKDQTIYHSKNPFDEKVDYEIRRIAKLGDSIIVGALDKFGFVFYSANNGTLLRKIPYKQVISSRSPPQNVKYLGVKNDTLICGSKQGLFLLKIGKDLSLSEIVNYSNIGVEQKSINHVYQINNGDWAISTTSGLFILNRYWQKKEHLNSSTAPILDDITNYCFEDYQRNLWILNYKGVQKLTAPKPFFNFTKSKTSEPFFENPNRIIVYRDSIVLMASWTGLFSFENNRKKSIPIYGIPKGYPFYDFYETSEGIIASGLPGNYLLKLSSGSIMATKLSSINPINSFTFCTHLRMDSVTTLFGSEFSEGLYVVKDTLKQLFTTKTSGLKLTDNSINKLYKDAANRIWCLHDKSIDIIDWKTLKVTSIFPGGLPDSPNSSVFFDIVELSGRRWIATYGGGVLYQDTISGKWDAFTTVHGLANNSVYSLIIENDSILWATTNIGLSRINVDNFTVHNYFGKSDNNPISFDERSAFSNNYSLFFGGPDGILEIDKKGISNKSDDSKVYVKSISFLLNGTRTYYTSLNQGEFSIPFQASDIRLVFASIDFIQPEINQFAYRLSPNLDWIPLLTNSEIVLSGLLPGKYTLEVLGSNSNGDWQRVPLKKFIIVPAPWYQTLWFKALLIFLIASLFYALYRYRLYQIQKENNIRTGIAADLHDDLGSTLTGIKVYSELGTSTGSSEYYTPVKQGLQEASLALREMIWVLDSKTNTVASIFEKLEKNVQPLLKASGIELNIHTAHGLEKMICKTNEKRDLYLLLKEFINNSIKYAECNCITMSVIIKGKKVQLEISDNGRGFDVGAAQQGNGLGNIKVRANRSGFIATFISERDKGTKLILSPI